MGFFFKAACNDEAVMSDADVRPPTFQARRAYLWAIISEIHMLTDYIAGSSTTRLCDIKINNNPSYPNGTTAETILRTIDDLEAQLDAETSEIKAGMLATTQTVRDALGSLVLPVSGLTIAYTALVTGNRRGRNSESRNSMAARAYPGLIKDATHHARMHKYLLCFILLIVGLTVWESAKVALGKSLMQDLDFLRPQQAVIYLEKVKLEISVDKVNDFVIWPLELIGGKGVQLGAYAICDRPMVLQSALAAAHWPTTSPALVRSTSSSSDSAHDLLRLYTSPQERDICERDFLLRTRLELVRDNLNRYLYDWPAMVGTSFATIESFLNVPFNLYSLIVHPVNSKLNYSSPQSSNLTGSTADPKVSPSLDDVEFKIAPILLVWSNYILPVLFSFLGSALYVTLDDYNKTRGSSLHPKDLFLSQVRLVLGVATGACIGLFVSSYSPAQIGAVPNASALVSSLTLTASGISFLAGFGVEGVFTMLKSMVERIFPPTAAR